MIFILIHILFRLANNQLLSSASQVSTHYLSTDWPHSDLQTLKLHCKGLKSPPCCLMFRRFISFFKFTFINHLQSQVLLILTSSWISWVQLRLSTAKADTRPRNCSPLHTVWKFHCLDPQEFLIISIWCNHYCMTSYHGSTAKLTSPSEHLSFHCNLL